MPQYSWILQVECWVKCTQIKVIHRPDEDWITIQEHQSQEPAKVIYESAVRTAAALAWRGWQERLLGVLVMPTLLDVSTGYMMCSLWGNFMSCALMRCASFCSIFCCNKKLKWIKAKNTKTQPRITSMYPVPGFCMESCFDQSSFCKRQKSALDNLSQKGLIKSRLH